MAILPAVDFARPLEKPVSKKKIICVGGHPDDPESGCGGTLARLSAAGHDVTAIYLTTGEAGIMGKSHVEASQLRKKEAINACAILKAKPVFFGQIDGSSVLDNDGIERMAKLFSEEKPDLVFAHWPLDSHKDHQIASLIASQMRNRMVFSLYYYEVCSGMQTMGFHPTDYIDITETQEQKREAVYCHVSQDPAAIYACGHTAMESFRGLEIGTKAAEAFVRLPARPDEQISLQDLIP